MRWQRWQGNHRGRECGQVSYANVGKRWTPEQFRAYLATIPKPAWAKAVCLHHTASPSLAMRPGGLTEQHVKNLQSYYQNDLKWKAGPHLFADDHLILGLSPLTETGTHAKSFNGMAIGIEVLGDYDSEDPTSGRGLKAWQNGAAAAKALLDWLGLKASAQTVLFHRDDPKTSKTCPGTLVKKDWVLQLIA